MSWWAIDIVELYAARSLLWLLLQKSNIDINRHMSNHVYGLVEMSCGQVKLSQGRLAYVNGYLDRSSEILHRPPVQRWVRSAWRARHGPLQGSLHYSYPDHHGDMSPVQSASCLGPNEYGT